MRGMLGPTASWLISTSLLSTITHGLSPRTEIKENYDFVIVGGGQAGLVLGSRLSEDKNHTVLVLEAGSEGDEYRKRIDTPALGYFDSLWYTPLDWSFRTKPQSGASNREMLWPRGKVLGGSSAINGLYLNRPGEIEINAWQDMLEDMDGADNWSWESLYAAMVRSEKFTEPSKAIADEAAITWDASDHGFMGPIHVSYPGWTFPQVGKWSKSLQNMGIPPSADMYGGESWGTEVSASTINPKNMTRSYSRTGYLDPLPDDGNYDVLANAHVTRLVFGDSDEPDNFTATAVEYTTDMGKTKTRVKVNKEVILAAGSVGSPAVLLHSGVGPKEVLSDAGVDLISELPGVGQHLQDHLSATITWKTNVDTAGSIWYGDGEEKNNELFLSFIDSAIAYVNATSLYGGAIKEPENDILDRIQKYKPDTSSEASVVAGYEAIYNTTVEKIFNSPVGQIELLLMNSDGKGLIGITAAIQHPYSHGRIYIDSDDPMESPIIDPNYLHNPTDCEMLREGLKLARRLGHTAPLSDVLLSEKEPGLSVKSDEQWENWLREQASTEFHPSSSCAMLPKDKGGVVDAKLRVYGLTNVRVADASVPPISFSAHLMGSTYGIAEQASRIIRRDHWKKLTQTKTTSDRDPGESEPAASETVADDVREDKNNSSALVPLNLGLILATTLTLGSIQHV